MNGCGISYEDVITANVRNQKNKEIENLKQEVERLKNINEEHRILNGKLRVENSRLNNIINEFNSSYSKIIKECEEMINDRYYMNENAIKYHANRIRDIAKYYIEEPKWQELKGSEKE